MDDADLLRVIAASAARTADVVRRGDLAAPVPWCGAWTVRDVVVHLGGVHRWALAATRTDPAGPVPDASGAAPAAADGPDALAAWLQQGVAALCAELAAADRDRPCWTLAPPAVVASWTRRQAHETAMHGWDVEQATGGSASIAPDLAADGVAEVLEVMLPRQVRLGRHPAPAVALEVVADGRSHHVGPGALVARVSGTACDLLLALWRRPPVVDPVVEGDAGAWAALLAGAPTP